MKTQINSDTVVSPELTYKIIGILFKVHNELGSSMLEKYYQRAVEIELKQEQLPFIKEAPVELSYRGKCIGKYYLDFIIMNKVILELKASKSNDPKFFKQVLSYLHQTHIPLAILANFRRERLEYKRIINADYYPGKSEKLSASI